MTSAQQPDRKCVQCGRMIGWDMNICPYCGKDYRFQAIGAQAVAPSAHKDHTWVVVVIVLIVIAVVIGVIAVAFVAVQKSASVTINVYSTHILFSVDYVLYVDGSAIDSGSIDAGMYVYYDYTYHWTSGDSAVAHFSATSSGGGFGSQSDSQDVVVTNGGAYVVDLYI